MLELLNLAIEWLPWIVTGASAITAATPTPKDDNVLSFLYKVVEAFGLVVGKAKQ